MTQKEKDIERLRRIAHMHPADRTVAQQAAYELLLNKYRKE